MSIKDRQIHVRLSEAEFCIAMNLGRGKVGSGIHVALSNSARAEFNIPPLSAADLRIAREIGRGDVAEGIRASLQACKAVLDSLPDRLVQVSPADSEPEPESKPKPASKPSRPRTPRKVPFSQLPVIHMTDEEMAAEEAAVLRGEVDWGPVNAFVDPDQLQRV